MTGRRRHYAHFYGLAPVTRDDRPLVLVHGNCQAESVRVLLDFPASPVRTVRVPPVHELTADDLPHLHALLEQVDVVVSQPVRDGYRDLPVGTAEVVAAGARRPRLVVVPVVRWAALHPFQVIVRSPAAGEPPVVPYHDLRVLAQAAGRPPLPEVPAPAAVRAVRELSVGELARRHEAHGSLPVTDLLLAAGAAATHTVNHPGNDVLRGLAGRVLGALGVEADVPDPGRTLLDSIHTPVAPQVLDALGLAPAAGSTSGPGAQDWLVHGERVPQDVVRAEHLRWYGEHPGVAEAGLVRHAAAYEALAA
ncbi:WcbI family polysaccharide biosynthesis putative acetyltransferase [Kineococcus rhizosphaerae]|uniref:Polysaccharide biosynthesis enzyme WcbI domain-containing protein n=1 Tax=Kineococcus rhizosphaerae TaxID=559628 RepID=A0A2T0QYY1_9ACTN|nr:WcbI family polysaccharide biosynthesis putative acetyltransferase [Kineococcus rhizosphaerae]PRY11725.1 hypothetical protein CLV37_11223 [Kineococcus rhizosphaerae]